MSEELSFTHLNLRGEGIATRDGREVAVPGVFAGERAKVQIVHRSRQHPRDAGRIVSLVETLDTRRLAPCQEHESRTGRCGGCPLMQITEAEQREQKRVMLASLGLTVERVIETPALGYRRSAKRVAFVHGGGLRLGSWARGTHDGAPMRDCPVDHPRLRAAANELEDRARALGVEPYDEASASGDLRYAWLKTDGERVLLTLVSATETSRAAELAERLEVPAGIAWSVQPSRGNAIRGGTPAILVGEGSLHINLAGVPLEVGPLGFLQPNPGAIAEAYEDLVRDEPDAPCEAGPVWDLYAGTGATTGLLRARFDDVTPCERYPESAAALGVPPTDVEAFLSERSEAPVLVVANPPRKGLGAKVCAALIEVAPPHLRLMSCGPEGLARDLRQLREGGYELLALRAYDTLPQTPHVELVAKLRRGDRSAQGS